MSRRNVRVVRGQGIVRGVPAGHLHFVRGADRVQAVDEPKRVSTCAPSSMIKTASAACSPLSPRLPGPHREAIPRCPRTLSRSRSFARSHGPATPKALDFAPCCGDSDGFVRDATAHVASHKRVAVRIPLALPSLRDKHARHQTLRGSIGAMLVLTVFQEILALAGGVCTLLILVDAFRKSLVQGLLCLFVPLYVLYWGFAKFESPQRRTIMWIWLGAPALALALGMIMIFVTVGSHPHH